MFPKSFQHTHDFFDFSGFILLASLGERLMDAPLQMSLQYIFLNALYGSYYGIELGQDIHTVPPLLDHSLNSLDLPFNSSQPDQFLLMCCYLFIHYCLLKHYSIRPYGIQAVFLT